MALTARVSSNWRWNYTKTSDLADGKQDLDRSVAIEFATGVGANQANVPFADTRPLAGSASEDLDLTGVLTDVFGATLAQARVKAIRISAPASNPGNIVVGAAASNAWAALLNSTGTITIPPGGYFEAAVPTAAGWAVTAGTGDLLKVANSSGSAASYTIEFLGGAS
jgi:hypothetical protein